METMKTGSCPVEMNGEIPVIKYEQRLVAFLDILGFKNIIKDSECDCRKLETIFRQMASLKECEVPTKWTSKLVEIEESAQKKGLNGFDITKKTNCTCFSDTIVVSILVEDNNINEVASSLITNLSSIGAKLLSEGILLRGGMTIGNLIHNNNGVIMGTALIEACELEKMAKVPRIILSDKLIRKMNYPVMAKSSSYPYHQYVERFKDGCVGFHQMTYYKVVQSSTEMTDDELSSSLKKIKRAIINGLDNSFESPDIFYKYSWLKEAYKSLIILGTGLKEIFYELNENIPGGNIHYSYTDDFYYPIGAKKN